MHLHLPTMLWVMLLASATLSGSVLLVAKKDRGHDGLQAWGWGLLLHGLSYAVFALRFVGWNVPAIVVSNLLISATLSLHLLAVAQFQRGRTPPLARWRLHIPLLLTLLVSLALLTQHQWRSAAMALVFGVQALWLMHEALAPRLNGAREHGRLLLVGGAAVLAVLFGARFLVILLDAPWEAQITVPEPIQAFTYLISLIAVLMNTMGYVLMHKERAAELQHEQATHDPLTGVLNRRALMDALRNAVSAASRKQGTLSVLMLDLDHFKRVNDEHGHPAGDLVLKEVTRRVRQRLRLHDSLGRFGGEEFVVVLEDTALVSAAAAAESIRAVVAEKPVSCGELQIPVTISIGLHMRVPENSDQAVEEMIAAADRALYQAKQNGRNRVEIAGA